MRKLMRRLSDLVPGGSHCYSKGDGCFPYNAPRYLVHGSGCYVQDDAGTRYLDWAMGLRSVILGHNYEKVTHAVIEAAMDGVNFCRPTRHELELAELLHDIIPSAGMVKFGKSGSDATTAAVKLARTYTGQNIVLIASENPFISQHDWFIGTTVLSSGVPDDKNTQFYNFSTIERSEEDIERSYGWENIAAIVLDPATVPVTWAKLACIRELCDKHSVVFILDEVISGFRYGIAGVQGLFGITPDLSTFGKSMGNGFSVSALCGKRDIMNLGDRDHGNVFLLSGTNNAETTGLAAAIATISEIKGNNGILTHIDNIGKLLFEGLRKKIETYELTEHMKADCFCIAGNPTGTNPTLTFGNPVLKTIFDQHMIECGILMPYIAPSYSHTEKDVESTLNAVEYALKVVVRAMDSKQPKQFLMGGWCEKPVFERRNSENCKAKG